VLSASTLACHGQVQREGEMVHAITDRMENLNTRWQLINRFTR